MRQPSIRRGVRTRLVIFGTLALLLILFSAFSAYLTPYDPYLQDLSQAKAPPSAEHLLGTDRYGRDMLSRVIVGSRTSIFSTLLLVAAVTVLGTAVGLCGGFFGGWADAVLMRVSDIFLAFPGLVFALAVAGALGAGCTTPFWRWPPCPGPNMPGWPAARPWPEGRLPGCRRRGSPAAARRGFCCGICCPISWAPFW